MSSPATAPAFFGGRSCRSPGLAVFLNAGDPPFDQLEDIVLMLDSCRVDCLELAVPFPDSVSDGPVIRRSAARALAGGADLSATLAFVTAIRPRLRHLKIALLADWGYTAKAHPLLDFLKRVKDAGSDACLLHGLPPRLHSAYYEAAGHAGLPVVTTCYPSSGVAVLEDSARQATGYLYLVAHYGKTGSAPAAGYAVLAPLIEKLRGFGAASVAIGFGIGERRHVEAVGAAGADAAIVGSAAVSRIERALAEGLDPVETLAAFLLSLRPPEPVPDNSIGRMMVLP